MEILHLRPEPPGSGNVVARFNLALTDYCRLYNLKLVEKPGGRRLVYAPQAGGVRVATFARALADGIARAASAALGGLYANDRTSI